MFACGEKNDDMFFFFNTFCRGFFFFFFRLPAYGVGQHSLKTWVLFCNSWHSFPYDPCPAYHLPYPGVVHITYLNTLLRAAWVPFLRLFSFRAGKKSFFLCVPFIIPFEQVDFAVFSRGFPSPLLDRISLSITQMKPPNETKQK